jgi:Carbohydrate-selective porin, OprB family
MQLAARDTKKNKRRTGVGLVLVTISLLTVPCSGLALEFMLEEPGDIKLTLGGVVAGIYQYQFLDGDGGGGDEGGGAFALQPEVGIQPSAQDELFVKFGFGADNGLNDKTPFTLGAWGGDLEDDVKNIGGRDRDYLLTAWYKHTFEFSENHQLGLTGGLIDATDYLDENVYSNDEYTQFMNPALVNGPNAFMPSYDLGGALEWQSGALGVKGVVMNIGENDDGNSFWYYGLQLGYRVATSLGEGNYRVIFSGASDDFLNPQGINTESRGALLFSFDQEFGDILGAFVRFGWQDDKAAIDYEAIYSGGLNISGRLWRRAQDDIGIAYGYLEGGNIGIDRTQVFELYVRFLLNDYFAVTADLQYQNERFEGGGGPRGVIPGIRLTAEF